MREMVDKFGSRMLADHFNLTAAPGREIAPNTGANVTKFFTLATKS